MKFFEFCFQPIPTKLTRDGILQTNPKYLENEVEEQKNGIQSEHISKFAAPKSEKSSISLEIEHLTKKNL